MPEFGSGPAVGRASKEKQIPGGNDRKKGKATATAGVYPLRGAKGCSTPRRKRLLDSAAQKAARLRSRRRLMGLDGSLGRELRWDFAELL